MIAFVLLGAAAAMAAALLLALTWNAYVDQVYETNITADDSTAVLLGADRRGRKVFLKQRFRTMHAQIIGTTSAGKTESVVLPWVIKDIENGSGTLIIDGKSDRSFFDKLYAYAVRAGRGGDFRLFSLVEIDKSSSFNPLAGSSVHEAAERVFSSFQFENEYYRSVQFKAFHLALRLIDLRGEVPTMKSVKELLFDEGFLQTAIDKLKSVPLSAESERARRDAEGLGKLPTSERASQLSGLEAALSHFVVSPPAHLFNATVPEIDISRAMNRGEILYFQLPSMLYPFLASTTGKLILQCLQSAVARRHLTRNSEGSKQFFSVFLDDFQDYIFEGFGALLNKSRSANVGVVFSHQSLGDLDKVSPAFRNIVLSNTNIKVVMRSNDPETCEYFSKSFGTVKDTKTTERAVRGVTGTHRSGEGSLREVERFLFHPNDLKTMPLGHGVVTIPHPRGVKVLKIGFRRRPDLPPVEMPANDK